MSFTLDTNQIFTHADSIVEALLPVVYVVAGIGLGFVIVNKIIGAFR
jgi:hypothetical protein